MKHAIPLTLFLIAAALETCALLPYKPSSPLPANPSSKAISNVGDAPDYSDSSASAGKAKLEIASTMPAATAPPQDALNPEAVVSLPQTEITRATFGNRETYVELPKSQPVSISPPTVAEQMLAASNAVSGIYRTELPVLDAAAQDYANVLARTISQGHFVQGSDVEGRVRRFGFTGTIAGPVTISRIDGKPCRGLGEVIHYGSPTISGAFASLMKSDGHRDAIMEPSYDVAGFGYSVNQYTRQPIYVGVYGNSRQAAPAATAIPAARSAVSYTQPRAFNTCGPGGCGPAMQGPSYQYQRRGFFGRR